MNKFKKVLDISGFNPNSKNGFGSGLACGFLFVFDIPFTILSTIWNFFFKYRLRSLGAISFKDIYTNPTLGSILGFVITSIGIGGYFNQSNFIGNITYQNVWIAISCLLAAIDIIASINYNHKTKLN